MGTLDECGISGLSEGLPHTYAAWVRVPPAAGWCLIGDSAAVWVSDG